VGKKVEAKKGMAVIESVKSVSDVFSPVNGEVVEANVKLSDSPEIINKDPYGEGWLAKIKIEDSSALDGMMSSEEYGNFVKEEKH